jgi:Putative zinc finger motif, C2HC5-type
LEFVTAFISRLPPSPPTSTTTALGGHVPAAPRKAKKKTQPLNKFPTPARKPNEGTAYESADSVSKGYIKTNDEEIYAGPGRSAKVTRKSALAVDPQGLQAPIPKDASSSASSRNASPGPTRSKLPPGAQGSLVSDVPKQRKKNAPVSTSRAHKVHISGGTPMHGQSSITSDLDSAIRSLEIQTTPTLSSNAASGDEVTKRNCNCMATRHPLLAAAPNCLNCGKIICVKEGLGPCTFCGKPLLSGDEIQSMVQILREERGKEKMEAYNAFHKRAEVSKAPRAFVSRSGVSTPATSESERENDSKLAAAKQHRDKLLDYQETSARRTRIIDESADFEIPSAGQSMWATPQERALQLKKQQKVLREQEWQAKPEWEKRRMVVSVDLVGGKVIKRMGPVERPEEVEDSTDNETPDPQATLGTGAFSNNPLLGGLIRPTYKASTTNDSPIEGKSSTPRNTWRRVQDDTEDNEQWILNGGIDGSRKTDQANLHEEPPCG